MSLPKIEYPIITLVVPSTQSKLKFRPFLVKEEKLLLMAKESTVPSDILVAVKQIISNCCLEDKFNIDKLAIFDLEYLFLKLRSSSVDNKVTLSYTDNEDGKPYDFQIDLDDVKLITPDPKRELSLVKITEKSGIVMHYPAASLYEDTEFLNLDKDYLFELIVRCIDQI